MSNQTFASRAFSGRSTLHAICAGGATLVGLILLLYAFYVVPNMLPNSSSLTVGLLVFTAIVGLLSIVGAIGYWAKKMWGWYIHLISVLGQLFFPGTLFEFKLDLYHLTVWTIPVVSLVILIVMGINIRKGRTP